MKDEAAFEASIVDGVAALSERYGCRIEISSDQAGSLGDFRVTCSDGLRKRQAFGRSVAEAVARFRGEPMPERRKP